jgi:hypothetical protein
LNCLAGVEWLDRVHIRLFGAKVVRENGTGKTELHDIQLAGHDVQLAGHHKKNFPLPVWVLADFGLFFSVGK